MQYSLLSTIFLIVLFSSQLKPNQATIRLVIGTCHASSYLTGKSGFCTTTNHVQCCKDGEKYPQYHCSPPITSFTNAIMYTGGFTRGSDGGAEAECDFKFHSDNESIVALSTGWFDGKSRCLKTIRINGNGNSVLAKVVDECDSMNGCIPEQNFEQPCGPNNIVGSWAVWDRLGVPEKERGEIEVTWSDELSA